MTALAPPPLILRVSSDSLTPDGRAWASMWGIAARPDELLPGTCVQVYDVPTGRYGPAIVDDLTAERVYLLVDWQSLDAVTPVGDSDPPEWLVSVMALGFRGLYALGRALAQIGVLALVLLSRLARVALVAGLRAGWCRHKGHLEGESEGLAPGLAQCRLCGDLFCESAPTESVQR